MTDEEARKIVKQALQVDDDYGDMQVEIILTKAGYRAGLEAAKKNYDDLLNRRSLPEWRYQNDPKFKSYVDMMHALIHRAELTPTEVREAAMLACIHYESYQVRRIYLNRGQFTMSNLTMKDEEDTLP